MSEPTVFIVDDDEGVRDSIAELVSSIGLPAITFASALDFLDNYDCDRAGCLVLDVRMAHMSGPALQEKLVAMGATLPIVFISGHGDVPIAIKTIKAGAVDFVQKPYHDQQLLDSINEALRRDAAIRVTKTRSDVFGQRLTMLSEREREVFDLVVKGLSSKAIAKALAISHRTVEVHRSHILEKLEVRSVPEMIHLAGQVHE
jgi:two-component system response regulator DctR